MDSHKPLTAGEIEELKALEAKATPGPWAWEFTGDDNTCAVGTVMDENDNFIAGMVGQDAGTVVVDSVCPEVTNQQDAAFIAAARNVLPRLLSMLAPPPDAPLMVTTGGSIHSMCAKPGHMIDVDTGECLSCEAIFKAPTSDAAVREAVERLSSGVNGPWEGAGTMFADIRTLLRAVQAPRLTEEQREAVRYAEMVLRATGNISRADQLRAAFPEAFAGEVGNAR